MYGSCTCKNIELEWTATGSFVPRACQCSYCKPKLASYVSKPGTQVQVTIHDERSHRIVQQGTNTADFHECSACDELVVVTTEIDGIRYGVINSNCLADRHSLADPVETSLGDELLTDRVERRRRNWCAPVRISNDSEISK